MRSFIPPQAFPTFGNRQNSVKRIYECPQSDKKTVYGANALQTIIHFKFLKLCLIKLLRSP